MSKKRIRSRLENLFTDLVGEELTPAEQSAGSEQRSPGQLDAPANFATFDEKKVRLSGWAWEVDAQGNYVSCGPEVLEVLQCEPQSFLGKSILSYGLAPSYRTRFEAALLQEDLPTELSAYYELDGGKTVAVRVHILTRVEQGGVTTGWKGFTQRLPENGTTTSTVKKTRPARRIESPKRDPGESLHKDVSHPPTEDTTGSEPRMPVPAAAPKGVAVIADQFQSAEKIWTETGRISFEKKETLHRDADGNDSAAIAVPIQMQGVGDLLLEIVDEQNDREWTSDDQALVQEIAAQLALALDNAQLYMSVQQELAERIRAEQAILRRNKDLASLNQFGQQLSRLTTRVEIFDLLSQMIVEMVGSSCYLICTFNASSNTLSFPVYQENRKPVQAADRPIGGGIPDYVIRNRSMLLVPNNVEQDLESRSIDIPLRVPASLLAIPMLAGDRQVGAIVVQDFSRENAFDIIHAELLSTAASQATTALENADLFEQMQKALKAIETRERYQSNVARAAATLTEYGTKSLPDVLKQLAQAAECSRVYYARLVEDARGLFWSSTADWMDPSIAYLFDKTRIQNIPVANYPNWAVALRDKGWTVTRTVENHSTEAEFIGSQHIRSSLLLSVPGNEKVPGFIAFDQLSEDRAWQNDEINALRVAADAVANTFVRERLLDQLQVTLDETEGLYKASNRLALANDMQEMVTAILSGLRASEVNRAVLLLFEHDSYGKLSQITVGANWYSGRGAPPPPVGTEYLRARYERLFLTTTPVFYDDVLEAPIDKELQDILLHQNTRALAVLPLWSGKQQIGVLLIQAEVRHIFSGREKRTYPPLVDQMAISVENQRLFEQTQKALDETELLYNSSNRIAQASDARDMLSLVVEAVLPKGADRASLFLVNSDENGEMSDIEVVGAYDAKGDYQTGFLPLLVSNLPVIKSLTDEPLIINDITKNDIDPASRKTLETLRIAACCMVPLRSSGRLIGLLNATSRFPVEFSPEDTRLMRIVGNGIAVALEKQRLLIQAQRRALELQTASEIARDTASTLSLDLLLNRIVNMLSERFGFYHASIFLLDENGTYAVVHEATGTAGKEMKQRQHRLAVGSRSVVGTVTATGEPLLLNDVKGNSFHYPNPLLPDTRAEMGIPLKLGATVIGALDLQSRNLNSFSQDEVTVLQILADQIAIAIENARAYELSQKAIADMKEIDRVKSQFLANMSHELRTPLNSIIGFSRVILKGIDGPINDTQKQDLNAIYNSGQHLLNLINDILDLSKIEAGKMELAFSEVNLYDMVNSVMSTAVGLVKDKPIKLENRVPQNLPFVRADSTRVRQVMINFLSNAAKFTEEGSITMDASVVSGAHGRPEVLISVTDTGPGIAENDQGKLFLPFSQVDDSPTRKTGGTGLGLSICRSLIEMHEGRIGLMWSEVGKGSTFYFTLPVSMPDTAQLTVTSGSYSNVVLAIDDDLRVISLYERYLKPHGFQVVAVTNPAQALERVKEIRPFAITLDIMMPEKDGWQVLRDLKNSPEAHNVPIIVCSILESQEKGFSLGAADYLVKPFLQEDMINALNRINRGGQINEILVIDDDAEDLRLVEKMLSQNPALQIRTAQGGQQGIDAIAEKQPDGVVLDLFMPEVNGFDVLEAIRKNPETRQIPVVILTGADLSPEQHEQLSAFGQGVLAKGYLREKELLVVLEEALRKLQPIVPETKNN